MINFEELRKSYGDTAKFSVVGKFVIVHLDNPSEREISDRINNFEPEDYFFHDCPLCQAQLVEGGVVILD